MDAGLLETVMGPIWAALGAIGHKALSEAEGEAADETVQLGRRLLSRLLQRGGSRDSARPRLEAAAADVATTPGDEDFRVALRAQVKKALTGTDGVDDLEIARDLASLLDAASVRATAHGDGAAAVGHNEGIISTGNHATNRIHRSGA